MISLIMPTMWKPDHYKVMLPLFNQHPLVGEILVIDNNTANTNKDILNLEKVIYLPQEQNIYVNPAWNLGAQKAKYDKLCFYSDDCLINLSAIDAVYELLTPQHGLFGFNLDSIHSDEGYDVLDFPFLNMYYGNIIESMDMISYTFAVCFFAHKDSYYQIPENYKIFYGDKYLFNENIRNGKQNYAISDAILVTSLHTTSHSEELKDVAESDHKQPKL